MSKEEKNQDKNKEDCYTSCNKKYGSFDPKRLFCKKGCDSDEDSLFNIIYRFLIIFFFKGDLQERNLF